MAVRGGAGSGRSSSSGASGQYILGKEVEAFESALAEFWGVSHAVGTANGLDAIEIGLDPVNARRFASCELSLPIHPFLTEHEVESVVAACDRYR